LNFSGLNYSLANEDSSVERQILPSGARRVVAIAGSGARVVPLAARAPERLTCLDVSADQLALTELRVAATRELSRAEYLRFMGYVDDGIAEDDEARDRRRTFNSLPMSPAAKTLLGARFAACDWRAPIYLGAWERTFARLAIAVGAIAGRRAERIFEFERLEDQLGFLDSGFPRWRWRLAILLLGNATVFKGLMYRDGFPRLNVDDSSFGFYRRSLDQALRACPAQRNFFLSILFKGRVDGASGLPDECDPAVYEAAKHALRSCRVEFVQSDLLSFVERDDVEASFVSASDVLSYVRAPAARRFKDALAARLADDGVAVCRYYRFRPDAEPGAALENVNARYEQLLARDVTGVYRFEVLQRRGPGGSSKP
jgi:S-adenosylmethionine-diacylglycerol 3-amino-3-carboxypropyl transferase